MDATYPQEEFATAVPLLHNGYTMLDSTGKQKIKVLVKAYKVAHPQDYAMVCEAIAGKRKLLYDEYASVQGSQIGMRALYEIPDDLYTDLIIGLSEDEMLAFKSVEGSRWFAKTFHEFSLPKTI